MVEPAGRYGASHEVLMEQIRQDPERGKRLEDLEVFTQRLMSDPIRFRTLADGSIEIPVYVNVLYNTPEQNISDKQIASQITVLNEDFATINSDYNANSTYQSVKAGETIQPYP